MVKQNKFIIILNFKLFFELYFDKKNKYLSPIKLMGRFQSILLVTMIISGAMNTINDKLQNTQLVTEGIHANKGFYHPYISTFFMFVGQSLALPLYLILKHKNPQEFNKKLEDAKLQGKIINFNIFIISARAWMDLVSSTLQSVALNFVAASVYQMMRGGTIVTTFIFSVLIMKMRSLRRQWFGSILTVVGILIVGISHYVHSSQSSASTSQNNLLEIVGYILLIVSVIGNGFQFVYQQKLFNKYHIEPFFMVGVEGVTGVLTYIVLLTIFTFTPCPFGIEACVFNNDSQPFIELPDVYIRQLSQNPILLGGCIFHILSVYIFNVSGLYITKYINALARALCDVARTILIWGVGIVITVTIGVDSENYKWQQITWRSILFQLLGFILIVMGNLIYNKIVSFSWLDQSGHYDVLNEIVQQKQQKQLQQ